MKRLLIFVGLAGLFIAGCGEDNITCKHKRGKTEVVNKISYNEKYATKEHEVTKVYSSDPSALNKADLDIEEMIADFNRLDGCDGTVKIDGDTLTMTMIIDYTKINIDELYELSRYSNHNLIKNGKVKIADLQKYYENDGFTCE